MFDRFIEDRVCNSQLPEVIFFDQSINQKLNRSLTIGKRKHDCSFLDDRSDDVKETFIAPPPSNIGLPDNGTVYTVRISKWFDDSCFTSAYCLLLYSTSRFRDSKSTYDADKVVFTKVSSSWMLLRYPDVCSAICANLESFSHLANSSEMYLKWTFTTTSLR